MTVAESPTERWADPTRLRTMGPPHGPGHAFARLELALWRGDHRTAAQALRDLKRFGYRVRLAQPLTRRGPGGRP